VVLLWQVQSSRLTALFGALIQELTLMAFSPCPVATTTALRSAMSVTTATGGRLRLTGLPTRTIGSWTTAARMCSTTPTTRRTGSRRGASRTPREQRIECDYTQRCKIRKKNFEPRKTRRAQNGANLSLRAFCDFRGSCFFPPHLCCPCAIECSPNRILSEIWWAWLYFDDKPTILGDIRDITKICISPYCHYSPTALEL